MAAAHLETEIKLAVRSLAEMRRRLPELGYRIASRRVFEANDVFDTRQGTLRSGRRLLRLRSAGGRHTLTYKGPPVIGRHKSRQEIELAVADPAPVEKILNALGFARAFRYEKYRTEYVRPPERGVVTLDETPIGDFLELEGRPRWIDRTAFLLGFTPADYITASYATLYLRDCRRRGVRPANMVFTRT